MIVERHDWKSWFLGSISISSKKVALEAIDDQRPAWMRWWAKHLVMVEQDTEGLLLLLTHRVWSKPAVFMKQFFKFPHHDHGCYITSITTIAG